MGQRKVEAVSVGELSERAFIRNLIENGDGEITVNDLWGRHVVSLKALIGLIKADIMTELKATAAGHIPNEIDESND